MTTKRAKNLKEWVGKRPDSMPPSSVRLRIFEENDGRCHITGLKIKVGDKWDMDHKIALCNGGENRESNLAPALRHEHRKKTSQDVKQRAKNERIKKKHRGIDKINKPKSKFKKSPSGKITNRETGEVVREAFKPRD